MTRATGSGGSSSDGRASIAVSVIAGPLFVLGVILLIVDRRG